MAKLRKGILGPISGTIGPVVGGTWKGIGYLKQKPDFNKKTRKQSPKQLAHWAKFGFLTKWLKPLHPFVSVGFRHLAFETTEISAAFSYNYKAALQGEHPDFSIDYAKVRLSLGGLAGIPSPSLSFSDPGTLELQWATNNVGENAVFDDQLMLAIYCPSLEMADGLIGGTKRTALCCTFKLHSIMIGQPLHVYASFMSVDGKEISDSHYLGRIDPL